MVPVLRVRTGMDFAASPGCDFFQLNPRRIAGVARVVAHLAVPPPVGVFLAGRWLVAGID